MTATVPVSGDGSGSVLERIVRAKRAEVEQLRVRETELRVAAVAAPESRGLAGALAGGSEVQVIAEVKRRSPGAGAIRPGLVPAALAAEYEAAGAAAISVLTDREYFGGALEELAAVRAAVAVPVLRKDFILDAVQVWEARAAGADAVLLIVGILDDDALSGLTRVAEGVGMESLVEVHDARELDRALEVGAKVIGVNNRDLRTFRTSLEVTLELAARVPPDRVLVSESGIRGGEDVALLGEAGIDAVLVGEWLLRQERVGPALAQLARYRKARRRDG